MNVSPTEQRHERITQAVVDLAGGSVDDLKVLDLACGTGAMSLGIAQRGAQVLGMEGRESNLAVARARQSELGLSTLQLRQGDVRDLERSEQFDVVLCLGILYHLEDAEAFELTSTIAAITRRFAIIETQIALRPQRQAPYNGHVYWGRDYHENTTERWASLTNPGSFWPTRASLLNLLADVGFTSAWEILSPPAPVVAEYIDHIALIAAKGRPVTKPPRWPERLPRMAHPTQGRWYAVREQVARRRGGGLGRMFR